MAATLAKLRVARHARPARADSASDRERSLPLLRLPEETADIVAAEAALARLSSGARTIVFFGTGGSSLGGQTLAQLGGWNIPGGADAAQKQRPRTRFYDNLDPVTLQAAPRRPRSRRRRASSSPRSRAARRRRWRRRSRRCGAVKAAGLEARCPSCSSASPSRPLPAASNGLRDLLEAHGIPAARSSPRHRRPLLGADQRRPAAGDGARPRRARAPAPARAMVVDGRCCARPLPIACRAGASAPRSPSAWRKSRGIARAGDDALRRPPAAASAPGSCSCGRRASARAAQGTTPIACLGPLDQHSQLQLFMDGPREHVITVLRVADRRSGANRIDAGLAKAAGLDVMAGRTVGDLVAAQSHGCAGSAGACRPAGAHIRYRAARRGGARRAC